MSKQSDARTIESFHLGFLQVFAQKGRDDIILKGGANLRYFFMSIRYSNDIDFDFVGRDGGEALARAVDNVLDGRPFGLLLKWSGIELVRVSKPKQTDTTRRWRLGIRRDDMPDDQTIATKIEFSARTVEFTDIVVERIPDDVVGDYGYLSPTIRHYGETAAIEQKMWALADRSGTKARDVFDLDLLFRGRRAAGGTIDGLSPVHAERAAERALALTYSAFEQQVVPFLRMEFREMYGSPESWRQMCDDVVDSLLSVAKNEVN